MNKSRSEYVAEWRVRQAEIEQERDQWKHAAEVWQARYQELVMEPLPRLLYRRALVRVARLLGGKP